MTAVREWEARNAQSLREQEARARLEQEQEQLLTYTREDAYSAVRAPPRPPVHGPWAGGLGLSWSSAGLEGFRSPLLAFPTVTPAVTEAHFMLNSISPPCSIHKFMNYQIRYVVFMDNIHAKGIQLATLFTCPGE